MPTEPSSQREIAPKCGNPNQKTIKRKAAGLTYTPADPINFKREPKIRLSNSDTTALDVSRLVSKAK